MAFLGKMFYDTVFNKKAIAISQGIEYLESTLFKIIDPYDSLSLYID